MQANFRMVSPLGPGYYINMQEKAWLKTTKITAHSMVRRAANSIYIYSSSSLSLANPHSSSSLKT